ncbi:hypothetical protein ON010_g6942 [Phytophthora cinnamomi]|nr:hypothetical protein ON010_g6942 [Phytophthora cinnamomi]
MAKRRIAPDGGTGAQLAEVASFLCSTSRQLVGSQTIHRKLLSSKRTQNKIYRQADEIMVASPATRTASSAPGGAGSAKPGVGSRSSAPNDGRSSCDESEEDDEEEEETEQQASGSIGGSPDSRAQGQASASSPCGNSSTPTSQPQGPSAGVSKSLQALSMDRAGALQYQGHLSSGQGFSSRKPGRAAF